MHEKIKFSAVIKSADQGGAYVEIPFDIEKIFGKKRVPVKATIDGEPYRGSLVRMGTPNHILIVKKDIREKIGKDINDSVLVTIVEDTELRVVLVPEDLKAALKKEPVAGQFFNNLSYTHQKEYVNWIEEAKKEQSRSNRIQRTIEMLLKGMKERS
jgi:hypothetical protein